jgi:hypothetical protein
VRIAWTEQNDASRALKKICGSFNDHLNCFKLVLASTACPLKSPHFSSKYATTIDSVSERSKMPEPFRPLDYVLCAAAFFIIGIAAVPLMTAWVR